MNCARAQSRPFKAELAIKLRQGTCRPLTVGESSSFRKKFFKVSVLYMGLLAELYGNPQDHTVIHGSAAVAEMGNVLEIQTADRTILHWDSFSIQAGEMTSFIQPSASSAVLNRVTGSEMSQIMGHLHSNGQVYLVNPQGILIGPEGKIDTAAFIASAVDLQNVDFLRGESIHFQGTAGDVVHLGTIETSSGPVVLIGHKVEHAGAIHAPHGAVSLLSGCDLLLDVTGHGLLFIKPDFQAQGIQTLEELTTSLEMGLSPTALAIGLEGTVTAQEIYVDAAEGSIQILPSGRLQALEKGTILVHAETGAVACRGTIESPSGTIHVLGTDLLIADAASLDVSGDFGGGEILASGDTQWIGPEVQIALDAKVAGDGGKAMFWGNRATIFSAQVSAQGGPEKGNGGFVEISSPGYFSYNGLVDATAPQGQTGTLLLDPTDFTISTGSNLGYTFAGTTYTGTANTAVLNTTTLTAQLALTNVIVDATGGPGIGSGVIAVANDIIWNSARSLTLQSVTGIIVSANTIIQNTGSGTISFTSSAGSGLITITPPYLTYAQASLTIASGSSLVFYAGTSGPASVGPTSFQFYGVPSSSPPFIPIPELPPATQAAIAIAISQQTTTSDQIAVADSGSLEVPSTPSPKIGCRTPSVSVQGL